MHSIVLLCRDPHARKKAQSLSLTLNLPLLDSWTNEDDENPHIDDVKYNYCLIVDSNGLSLSPKNSRDHGAIRVDFAAGAHAHRRNFGGGHGQNIAKALGISGSFKPLVFDLTAGLGGDSFVFSSLGCAVVLFERQPIVAALLRDGIDRASVSNDIGLREIVSRLNLQPYDSIEALERMAEVTQPDVIYMDPMFPERKKSAKVKKEMQVFHNIVGGDEDSVSLLKKAIDSARYRIVVKRPSTAGFLGDLQPTYSLKGKSTRFDIFALRKLPS